jgi:hypothetical protein
VALEKEMDTFLRELPRLLADPLYNGMFALIRGDEIVNAYSSFETALAAGYDRFGLEPFLIKEVVEHEQPKYFSRNLRCPT